MLCFVFHFEPSKLVEAGPRSFPDTCPPGTGTSCLHLTQDARRARSDLESTKRQLAALQRAHQEIKVRGKELELVPLPVW